MARPPLSQIKEEAPLPSAYEAEKGLIACCMTDNYRIPHMLSQGEDLFYHADCLAVRKLMVKAHKDGVPSDMLTLLHLAFDQEKIYAIGGPAALAEFAQHTPSSLHYNYFLEELKSCRLRRRVILQSQSIKNASLIYTEDDSWRDAVLAECNSLSNLVSPEEEETGWENKANDCLLDFQAIKEGRKKSSLQTRWGAWNAILGGLTVGLHIIKGRSSSGKSTVAMNLFNDLIFKGGMSGALLSLEMDAGKYIKRMVCDLTGLSSKMVFHPDIEKPSPEQEKLTRLAVAKISQAKILFSEDGCLLSFWQRCRKFKPQIIVVDYTQLLQPPPGIEKNANNERAITENTRMGKLMAQEFKCPTIFPSQVNKEGDSKGSKGPEEHADTVYMITSTGVYVEKNRDGEKDREIPILIDGAHFRFLEQQQSTEDLP